MIEKKLNTTKLGSSINKSVIITNIKRHLSTLSETELNEFIKKLKLLISENK